MNRRNRITQKSWKDYIIPVLGVLLIFLLIISFFGSKWWDTTKKPVITKDNLEVSVSESVDAYTILSGGKKSKIETTAQIFSWERLYVKSGTLESFSPNFKLAALWELRYDAKNKYALFSSNLWLNPTENTQVEMRFLSVNIPAGTIVSLTQNDAASSVYVLKWSAIINNIDKTKELTLNKWQKVSVFWNEAKKEDLDLVSKVESIPDYILEEDWFVKNDAKSILALSDGTDSEGKDWDNTGENVDWEADNNSSSYIMFTTEDWASVDKDEIIIEWELLKVNISKITLDDQEADINKDENIFKLEKFKLKWGNNDIIYKVYGEDGEVVSKGVLSIFNTATESNNFASTEVKAYPINPEYGFNLANPLTTTANFVTIKWFVPKGKVNHIKVNGYQLRQFPKWGTSWRYHADATYNLLKDWMNLYNIEYFDENNKKIHETLYIIKKVAPVKTPVAPTSKEAN